MMITTRKSFLRKIVNLSEERISITASKCDDMISLKGDKSLNAAFYATELTFFVATQHNQKAANIALTSNRQFTGKYERGSCP
jgi:hypothetical protein